MLLLYLPRCTLTLFHKKGIFLTLLIYPALAPLLLSDTISIVFENDLFAQTDKHYTNGLRLGWISDPLSGDQPGSFSKEYTLFLYHVVDSLPLITLDADKKHNAGFSVHQMMFTPQDITSSTPNYNDIPYAGHLMFSSFLFEYDDTSYDEYKMQLGIVGPASGAESVQKFIHKITDSTAPQGWDTQLPNQLTAGIAYDHGDRLWEQTLWDTFSTDFIGSYGCQLNNFYTGATIRGVGRFGQNYPKNFNAYFNGTISDSALLALQYPSSGFGWSVNAGIALDAVAYFYVTDADSNYMIDRDSLLSNLLLSFSFYYKEMELSLTRQMHYSLVNGTNASLTYGAASLLWKF